MRDSAHATSKHPFQGSGVSAEIRGTARAQRECESRFPLQRGGQKETPIESKKPCISAIYEAFFVPLTPVDAKGSK